ncbi:MAG: efflux RND transporter periplasmic adaptor subunit [Burkholderiales bacterium]
MRRDPTSNRLKFAAKPPRYLHGAANIKFIVAAVVALGVVLGLGVWPRVQASKVTEPGAESGIDALPTVTYVLAKRGDSKANLILPASLHPLQETTIYSRTTGYVKRVAVDIGAKVKQGDLLAEVDAPEADREIEQTKANERQIQSKFDLAKQTAERYRRLAKENAVSQQEVEEKNGAVKVLQADLGANTAQIKRLQQLKAYQQVLAPFSGTIVARNIDVGAMIIAGSSTNSIWLFKLVQTDTLRVTVSVPQSHMRLIKEGSEGELLIPEMPDKKFLCNVARSAGAFDAATRTMVVELEVANREAALTPGMYGQVKFHLVNDNPNLVVPIASVLIRGDGAQVVTVADNEQLQVRKVKLGRDLGKAMEVLEGLTDKDKIVINPRDNVTEGLKVKAVLAKEEPPKDKILDAKSKPIASTEKR